jgi:hypothetical protein
MATETPDQTFDFKVRRGSRKSFRIRYVSGGSPVDLTGSVLTAQVRAYEGGELLCEIDCSDIEDQADPDHRGWFWAHLLEADTRAITGKARYVIERMAGADGPWDIVAGTITAEGEYNE